jgi:acetyl esterase/lipase
MVRSVVRLLRLSARDDVLRTSHLRYTSMSGNPILLPGLRAAGARVKTQEWDGTVQNVWRALMKGVSECAVLTIAFAALAQPPAHPPELLHPKGGPHKRANWRHIVGKRREFGLLG